MSQADAHILLPRWRWFFDFRLVFFDCETHCRNFMCMSFFSWKHRSWPPPVLHIFVFCFSSPNMSPSTNQLIQAFLSWTVCVRRGKTWTLARRGIPHDQSRNPVLWKSHCSILIAACVAPQFVYHAWVTDSKTALKERGKGRRQFWKRYGRGRRHRKDKEEGACCKFSRNFTHSTYSSIVNINGYMGSIW